MIREVSRLMLRAYNAEADNCVRTLRPHTLQSAMTRLDKARDTIARLGKTMSIQISGTYHRARLLELELTADYLVKQEEEKDRIRAERERQKEEEAARRDFEREKTRLMKEQAHHATALPGCRTAATPTVPPRSRRTSPASPSPSPTSTAGPRTSAPRTSTSSPTSAPSART